MTLQGSAVGSGANPHSMCSANFKGFAACSPMRRSSACTGFAALASQPSNDTSSMSTSSNADGAPVGPRFDCCRWQRQPEAWRRVSCNVAVLPMVVFCFILTNGLPVTVPPGRGTLQAAQPLLHLMRPKHRLHVCMHHEYQGFRLLLAVLLAIREAL